MEMKASYVSSEHERNWHSRKCFQTNVLTIRKSSSSACSCMERLQIFSVESLGVKL